MTNFAKAYKSLNLAQKKAVDTIDGPVMVIAGPGTGKTQILATRIANILEKTDTDPGSILALTFTDAATQNMRQRLLSLIGPTAYRLNINTFHSFSSSIIQEFPDHFIYSESAQPLTDLERYNILHQIIDQNDFELLKPVNAPYYYIYTQSAISSAISSLKREGITPDRLKEILSTELKDLEADKDTLNKTEFEKRNKDILKNLDLLKFYDLYQQELLKRSRYDFDDMINWLLHELAKKDSELLPILQERFHYFLIDEYQDTNSAQNEIIDLLASYWGDKANIFVVGDDEQSIFRFQGASLENALNFTKTYPSAKIINLTENYRSNQNILDATRILIENNKNNLGSTFDLKRQLNANVSYQQEPIKLLGFNAEILEQYFVTQDIKNLLNQGTDPNEIAIIAHTNAELKSLANVFTHLNVPFQIQSGLNILETLPIIYLLTLFRVILESRTAVDDLDLFTLMHYPFLNLDSLDILKTTRAAAQSKKPLIDYINSDNFRNLKLNNPESITALINQIASFNEFDSNNSFVTFFEKVLTDSGLLSWVLANHPNDLRHLNSLFEFAQTLTKQDHDLNLARFLKNIDLIEKNNLTLSSPELGPVKDRVTLTTAHKSKGLEWKHVYIIGCIDGRWGNQSSRNLLNLPTHILKSDLDHDPLEDERRLFYVALTRAKQNITITYSKTTNSYNRLRETLPSLFILELPEDHLQKDSPTVDPEKLDSLLQSLLTPATIDFSSNEAELINQILKDFKLSATALNQYLECPYKFKLNQLLKVPKAKEPHLSFGTAVHSALEKFYKHYLAEHQFPSLDQLLLFFETALTNEIISPLDHQQRLKQGKLILKAYYKHHQDDFRPALEIEKFLGYGYNPIFLDDIPLGGKIDRIDWIDQTDRTVKVIDYKTGKRKTRGQIEGTTQDSDGSYKRQLVFYKLLADLDQKFPATVTSAELDFVESPHHEGKSGKEIFKLAPEEVEELKQVIKHCMAEIRAHKFNRTSDYSICTRCEFVNHCWPKGIPTFTPEQLTLITDTSAMTQEN